VSPGGGRAFAPEGTTGIFWLSGLGVATGLLRVEAKKAKVSYNAPASPLDRELSSPKRQER